MFEVPSEKVDVNSLIGDVSVETCLDGERIHDAEFLEKDYPCSLHF